MLTLRAAWVLRYEGGLSTSSPVMYVCFTDEVNSAKSPSVEIDPHSDCDRRDSVPMRTL